jgi:hypothetical protein
MERERAARERAQRQAFREAERAQRAYERATTANEKEKKRPLGDRPEGQDDELRATTANEKEKKRLYREAMLARAAAMTDDVETNVSELEGLLPPTGRRSRSFEGTSLVGSIVARYLANERTVPRRSLQRYGLALSGSLAQTSASSVVTRSEPACSTYVTKPSSSRASGSSLKPRLRRTFK